MVTSTPAFAINLKHHTLIVTVLKDLRESDYLEIDGEARDILRLLDNRTIRNVVLDFHKTDYYGSTALGFFCRLWKRVREGNGRMAFCSLSDHEREILEVTKLDGLWPICSSRKEALEAVGG